MKNLTKGLVVCLLSGLLAACGGSAPNTENTETKLLAASDSSGASTTQWTFCANENGNCLFTGTQTVRYGAGSSFVSKSLAWGAACNNNTFGDPAPGQAKHCEVTSAWAFCANENGQCGFSDTRTVRYGAGSTFVTQTVSGGAACTNNMFGDPISGSAKHCDTTATTWTECASEGGNCSFSGTRVLLYGANGNFATRTLNGSAACNNNTFGDPAPGAAKKCYLPGAAIADAGSPPPPPPPSGFVVTEAQFNQMFPNRSTFYTYSGLITAMGYYPAFATSGSDTVRKQEAAAFLANVAHESDYLKAVREYNTANWPGYCSTDWGNTCAPGQQYYGRGPIQLSWNYNYKAAGDAIGVNIWANPELVATDAAIAWRTGLWYWMTGTGSAGVTPHNAMVNSQGFGVTIRAINGTLECNGGRPDQVQTRVTNYQNYTGILGVAQGSNLYC